VIAGGEECPGRLAGRFGSGYTFYNEYGPTETTVTAIEHRVAGEVPDPDAIIAIGRPIRNTRVYVLDSELALLAPGVKGDLYIGGAGLATGYLGDASSGKFLPDPFHPGERMYRTGDLAKWLPDGNLAFYGRTDDQVKLRGYRIELGEINSRLSAYESVGEAVVVVREVGGERSLVAYYTGDAGAVELRSYLQRRLPDYMVPACFVRVDAMPLTPTGKIDRRALPEPVFDALAAYAAPTNEVEAQLVKIWSEVLGTEVISIHSNYFDLGGHSLSIIKMNKMINDHFNCTISVGTIFRLPNIHALADFIINGDTKIKQLEAGLDEREDALGLLSELIN
jgi:acyl carrier protein